MTKKLPGAIIKTRNKSVLIFTIGDKMSFVISKKQHLAPTEARIQYEPLIFEDEGFEVKKLDVSFGHPLYTAVADIFYIRSLWDVRKSIPVIPDGCMTLVFTGGSEHAEAYICGVIDEIKKIDIEPGDYCIFMRFMPGTGYSLVEQPVSRITNKALNVRENMAGGEQIISILGRETQLVERIGLISKVIRINLYGDSGKYLIKYCTRRILQTQGNIKVEELAEETGFTSRNISKMFEKFVGISPKLYSQIIRLQFSMAKIMENRNMLLMDVAIDCGFFDHAHMNRTYKKLIRCSSGEFRKNLFNNLDYDQIEDYISVE